MKREKTKKNLLINSTQHMQYSLCALCAYYPRLLLTDYVY